MNIVDWMYGDNPPAYEGVCSTLSELRPNLAYRDLIYNFINRLWGEDYADSLEITISFKESVLNTFQEKYIKKMLKQHFPDKYRVFLLADYSTVGRLHFHGLIKPLNGPKGLDYLRRKLVKIFGRTEIKPIRCKIQWLTYMFKYYYKYEKQISATCYITNDIKMDKCYETHNLEDEYKQNIDKCLQTWVHRLDLD